MIVVSLKDSWSSSFKYFANYQNLGNAHYIKRFRNFLKAYHKFSKKNHIIF